MEYEKEKKNGALTYVNLSSLTALQKNKRRLQWRFDQTGIPISYRRSWCERYGYLADNLATIRHEGEAMAPLLECGGSITIDLSDTELTSGNVYAIDYLGMLFIRRLFWESDGTIQVLAENPDKKTHPDWYLRPEDRHALHILGRVVQRQANL